MDEDNKDDEADTPRRVKSSPMIIIPNNQNVGDIENFDYTKNIKLYIE